MVETKLIITRARAISISTWLKVGIIAVALVAILVAVGIRVSTPNAASARALVGKPAPDFTLAVVTAPTAAPQTVSLATNADIRSCWSSSSRSARTASLSSALFTR